MNNLADRHEGSFRAARSRVSAFRRAFVLKFLPLCTVVAVALSPLLLAWPVALDPPPEDFPVTTSQDLDGDASQDALDAAPSGESMDGSDPGFVVITADDGTTVTIRGRQPEDWFGASAAVAGDLNQDGFRDLIIGAPREGPGAVYVFYGPFRNDESPELNVDDADMMFRSPIPDDYDFGMLVGPVSDMNCDGVPELRMGAYMPDGLGGEIIHTYIVSGIDGASLYEVIGEDPLNPWIEPIGDADGDGDVDQTDVDIVTANQGLTGTDLTLRDGDFNLDASVDAADLQMAQANMGINIFNGVHGCCEVCGNDIPDGFHCVEDCEECLIMTPENVWPFCDPILCIQDCGCAYQINPSPDNFGLPREIQIDTEYEITVYPHNNESVDWVILDGAERIEVISSTGPTLQFQTLVYGSLVVRPIYSCCFSECGITVPMFITCNGIPNPLDDDDYDGIPNAEECEMGLDWTFSDTDGDSMPDPWELVHGFDPTDPSDGADDSDGDGIPNFLEYMYGSDPFNAASGADPAMDADGDGIIDWLETILGSDPFDPVSVPAVQFTSGDMAWMVVNDVVQTLESEMIELCPEDSFRLHATGWASSWHVLKGDNWVTEVLPDTPGSCISGRWNINADAPPGADIIVASATPNPNGPILGHLHVRVAASEDCDPPCLLDITLSDGGPAPEVVCVGDEITFRAEPNPGNDSDCDCTGSYQWTLLNGVPGSAAFVGDTDQQEVTLVIDGPGDIHISVTRGDCSGGRELQSFLVDLDIDSDNNNGFDMPDRSDDEDDAEADAELPGKLLPVNVGNLDDDAVPDFADGYNLDGVADNDDDVCEECRFVPLILELGEITDPSEANISFSYAASDPADVEIDGSLFEPAPGHLRIWIADADVARNKNSVSDDFNAGDYVAPGAHTAEALGLSEGVITLYVEGVAIQEGSALPISVQLDEACSDTVLVRLFDLEHMAFDDETGEEYPAESVAGPSNLTPELAIHAGDVHIAADGALHVEIEGHVMDRLSELADDPSQRLQEVQFYVNGEYHSAIIDLPALSPGEGVQPWQPHLLDVEFSTTIIIDAGLGYARPGGYVIEALTSPNAAGRTAKDTVFVTVQWHMLEDLFEAPIPGGGTDGLTMQFVNPPTDAVDDWAWIYFGDRVPMPTDGIVSESQDEPASLQFVGNLHLDDEGDIEAIPCTIQIDGPVNFTADDVDWFEATVTYEFSSGYEYAAEAVWVETADDSLRFIQATPAAPNAAEVGDDPDGGSYFIPIVMHVEDVDFAPEGPNGFMERTLVRVVGLGDDVDPSTLSGLVNGVETPLNTFTFSPPRHYFVHEQELNRPRIFVVTIDDLPPGIHTVVPDNLLISNDVINELAHELHINGHDFDKFVEIELFEDDFGSPTTIGEPPDGPLTLPVLLTYFQLLYGDTGLQLLQFYQDAGGGISIEDQWFWQDDWLFRYATASAPYTMEIEIDENLDPVTAVAYLWAGLRKALGYNVMQQQIEFSGENLDFWIAAMQQRAAAAAQITASAARLYYSGIAVVSEGADWVFTINELSQGHWEAAVGFLPYFSASMPIIGKVIVKTPGGAVVGEFSSAIANAAKQAMQLPATIADRFSVLQAAGANRQQMRAFVRAGIIPAPTNRNKLKHAMKATNPPDPNAFSKWPPHAHHELPWGIEVTSDLRSRDLFTEFGFDVNDPAFGKWAEGQLHLGWSNGPGGWNDQWKMFLINDLAGVTDVSQGRQMILNQLDNMRQGYLNGTYPLHY